MLIVSCTSLQMFYVILSKIVCSAVSVALISVLRVQRYALPRNPPNKSAKKFGEIFDSTSLHGSLHADFQAIGFKIYFRAR